jgi:hypothetical protein
MEPIRINTQEAYMYLALIGAGIGLLLGLMPLFLGIKKGKTRLGVIALICSIIAGVALTGFISLLVIAIFIWLIYKSPGDTTRATSEIPPDIDVEQ